MDRRIRITLLFTLFCLALTAPAALASYGSAVNADSPVAYWPLNEAPGATTAVDGVTASGHVAVPGTYASGVTLGLPAPFGSLGSSVGFDASGEVVTAGALSAAPLTAELWAKPVSKNHNQALVTVGDADNNGFSVGITRKRKLYFRTSGSIRDAKGPSMAAGRWTMVDVTWSATQVTFRMNGGATTKTWSYSGGAPADVSSVTVGTDAKLANSDFTGSVDEVALYPTALTVTQMRNHYQQTGAPLGLTPPAVEGTPVVGGTLSASTGTWQNPTAGALSYDYQWQRCNDTTLTCDDIPGATGQTLAVLSDYVGDTIQVLVTATNVNGSATNSSDETVAVFAPAAPDVAASNDTLPTVIGVPPFVGRVLGSTDGTWSGNPTPVITRQWQRCDAGGGSCVDIDGETGTAYTPTADDIGATLRLAVTGTNSVGFEVAHSAVTSVIPDPNTTPDPGPQDGSGNTNTGGTTTTGGSPTTNPRTNPTGTTAGCLRFTALPKRLNKKVKGLGRVRIGPVKGSKAGVTALKLQVRLAKGVKLKGVTWTLDGKKLKTAKKRPYTLSLLPAKAAKAGTHVLRAKLTPKKGKSRTLKTFVLVKAC